MASRDYVDLVNSLRRHSDAEALVLAARSALRVLPTVVDGQPDNINSILLPLLRASIMHSAVLLDPSSEARASAQYAAMSIADASKGHRWSDTKNRYGSAAANSTARSASLFRGAVIASKGVADAAADAVRASRKAFAASESETVADQASLGSLATPLTHFDRPLWSTPSVAMDAKREKLTRHWISDPETWVFWRYWYRGYHLGKPLDWELQRRVALIPDADWEQGAEHIARRIAQIQASDTVRARVEELETEITTAAASRLGIGGNNPPEQIMDIALPIPNDLVFVWEPLIDLKTETETETEIASPDPGRVRDILDRLLVALRMGLEWMAEKADLAVDTAIKWGVPAVGGGYFALNPSKLEAVIQAGEAWLSVLR